jgi:hypothetical protein
LVRVQAGELTDEKAQASGLGFSALWGLNGTAGHLWAKYSCQRVSVSGDASAGSSIASRAATFSWLFTRRFRS